MDDVLIGNGDFSLLFFHVGYISKCQSILNFTYTSLIRLE